MTNTHPPFLPEKGKPYPPFWPQNAREEQLTDRARDCGFYLIPRGGEWLLVDFGDCTGTWTAYPALDDVEQYLADVG